LKGTAEGFAESKRDFDEAIAKNPRLTLAIVQRGYASWLYVNIAGGDWTAALNEAERFARQAIAVDPLDAEAHIELADKLGAFGDFAGARAEVERGLKLNPSSADVMMKAALVMPALAQPERGAELCDRALHLNSMPVVWYGIHCMESYYFVGRFADSLDMARRTEAWVAADWWPVMWEFIDETELGDREAAAATLARFKRDYPAISLEGAGYATVYSRALELDRLVATMAKAGGPVRASPEKASELPKPLHIAQCDAERAQQAAR
jgi:tetratricopeptide (TPR) repeat protein